VIRAGLAALVLGALTACGGAQKDDLPAGRSDTRQIPTNTTPGLHISGHATVGVVRNF
jgi:hypothetical protein